MRIYVAGPLTQGDTLQNIRRAVLAGDALIEQGHDPLVPHCMALADMIAHQPYGVWMRVVTAWLRVAEALFVLPGFSPGTLEEIALAMELHIPIYYRLQDVPAPAPECRSE